MKQHNERLLTLIILVGLFVYLLLSAWSNIQHRTQDRIGCSDVKKFHPEINCYEIQKRFK